MYETDSNDYGSNAADVLLIGERHEGSGAADEQTTKAVEQWTARGGHRTAGITSPVAAAEMGIPRYQLTAWVKAQGYKSFSRWMTALRIDEAKRVLLAHPEWGSEAVADYCGFNSREYFHRIFKEHQGMTPAQYQKQNGIAVASS